MVKDVTTFLINYVEENAVLPPRRIPGFKNSDIKLLSSSETKMSVWHAFKASCEAADKQAVSYSKFIELWEQFHPTVGPDRCFCVIKRAYKVNYISLLYEFATMVETSSTAGVNKAQLAGTHDGRVIVPVYNWSVFLEQFFTRIPNIKKYHHFTLSRDEPGMVYFKEFNWSAEQSQMLLKNRATLSPPSVLPPKIHPEGLSEERIQ